MQHVKKEKKNPEYLAWQLKEAFYVVDFVKEGQNFSQRDPLPQPLQSGVLKLYS